MIDGTTAIGTTATIINTILQLFNAGSANSLKLNGGDVTIPINISN